MEKLVSIIVPVYNPGEPFTECLDSVLAQTYEKFELILVDDGSSDGSEKICDQYAEKDARVRVFHNENHGVSYTRNYGIDKAEGEYIMFVDADDLIEPGTLETFVNAAERYGVDLVIGGYGKFRIDENDNNDTDSTDAGDPADTSSNSGEETSAAGKQPIQYMVADYQKRSVLTPGTAFSAAVFQSREEVAKLFGTARSSLSAVSVWCKLYRAPIIKEHDVRFPENVSYEEDCCFNLLYYRHISSAVALKNIVYHYRQGSESLSKVYSLDKFSDLVNGYTKRREFLEELGMPEYVIPIKNIFVLVLISTYQKIYLSPISRRNKIKEYAAICDMEEVSDIAFTATKIPNRRLYRYSIEATQKRKAAKIWKWMYFWNLKNKVRKILRKIKPKKSGK